MASLKQLVFSALVLMHLTGCAGATAWTRHEAVESMDDGGGGGDSVSLRILALIARGQFTEAQVLIHAKTRND